MPYTIDRYDSEGNHIDTGTVPGTIPGAGKHPSAAWLAKRGWYRRSDLPAPPDGQQYTGPTTCTLVDGVSVPSRQTEPIPPDAPAAEIATLTATIKHTLQALGVASLADLQAVQHAAQALPDQINALKACVQLLAAAARLRALGQNPETITAEI